MTARTPEGRARGPGWTWGEVSRRRLIIEAVELAALLGTPLHSIFAARVYVRTLEGTR